MTTTEHTIQTLATEVAQQFETATRPDGTRYVCRKNEHRAEDWIQDMIRAAHGDMLPDDYVYQYASDALDAIAEGDEDGEYSILEPDVYTRDLLNWVGSDLNRVAYVDEAISEGAETLFDALTRGQLDEKQMVFDTVKQALLDRIDALEDAE